MIIEELLNTRPMALAVMACRIESDVLRFPRDEFTIDFNFCGECCFDQVVFAKIGNEFDHENDHTAVLHRQIIPTDTIDFELYKDGVKVADLNNNTLGEYFDLGAFPIPTYKGFQLDWNAVLVAHGAGCYKIKKQLNILNVASTKTSIKYVLQPYTDEAADETVRIDVIQNGYIINSEFDYTGMDWPQSVRFSGRFNKKNPDYKETVYQDSTRRQTQVQDSIIDNYTLELSALPSEVYNTLNYEMLLANNILISDYRLYNPDIFRLLPVNFKEFSKTNAFRKSRRKGFVYKFQPRYDNLIKRNVR